MSSKPNQRQSKQVGKKKKNGKKKNGVKGGKRVNAARAYGTVGPSSRVARVQTLDRGSVRVRHREYLTDVYSSGASDFELYPFRINAGNANMFPWLSGVALGFESYEFVDLNFHYVTQTSTAQTGTIVMAIDYDVLDPSPVDKQAFMAMQGAKPCPVWAEKGMSISVDQKSASVLGRKRYVLESNELSEISVEYPPRGDPKTYDIGYFNYAVCGRNGHAAVALGELYVQYDVILHTPQLRDNDIYRASGKVTGGGGGIATTKFFGNVPSMVGKAFLNTAARYVGNQFRAKLEEGIQYLVDVSALTTTALTGGPSVVGFVNADTGVGVGSASTENFTVAPTSFNATYLIKPPTVAGGAGYGTEYEFAWDTTAMAGGPVTAAEIRVSPYPYTYM